MRDPRFMNPTDIDNDFYQNSSLNNNLEIEFLSLREKGASPGSSTRLAQPLATQTAHVNEKTLFESRI